MWPNGPVDILATTDLAWKASLASKTYMMGVSPWFYTNLPGYNKAWVWRGDDTWHLRWQQVIDLQPDLVEIITWNDYGESHYIGPIHDDGIPNGDNANAHSYVDDMPHDHWRDMLPVYIAQYKNGGQVPAIAPESEKVTFWHRLSSSSAGSTDGVTGNNCRSAINIYGYQTCYSPSAVAQDKVFISALLSSPATVTVQIGSNAPTSFSGANVGVNHFSQAFNGQTGPVTVAIVRNGATVKQATGEPILASPAGGVTNFNAWVGGSG